jgi:hypothetical protein
VGEGYHLQFRLYDLRDLRKNLRQSAGKLSCALSRLKVRKHFPQIGADYDADER